MSNRSIGGGQRGIPDRFKELRPRFALSAAIFAAVLGLSIVLLTLKQEGNLLLALGSTRRSIVGIFAFTALIAFAFSGAMAFGPWLLDRFGTRASKDRHSFRHD